MKTTNYEISKKLAEIGFKAQFGCGFYKGKPDYIRNLNSKFVSGVDFPSYDFETILAALPHEIYVKNSDGIKSMFSEILYATKLSLFYGYEARLYWTKSKLDESLADTAARLLITLVEQGIINFK